MDDGIPSFMRGFREDKKSNIADNDNRSPGFMRQETSVSQTGSQQWNNDDYKMLIHPEDASAIDVLNGIPGFQPVVRGTMAVTMEKMFLGECLGTNIKLGPKQLSEYYDLLPPVCEKFGISPIPDLFLEMSPAPNAHTFGDKRPFIVISSGLLEYLSPEEVQIVLAHECGHIICHHVLYSMMATVVEFGVSWIPSTLSELVKLPIYRWKRMSEFSADRASLAFAGNVESAMNVMVRLSGGRYRYTQNINVDAYRQQLEEYRTITNDTTVEKSMQNMLIMYASHPFASVRSYEFIKWSKTSAFSLLSRKIGTYDPRCPQCGASMKGNTNICINGHFC